MSTKRFRQLTGLFFISGAVLVNIPYTLLIVKFDTPMFCARLSPKPLRNFMQAVMPSSTPGSRSHGLVCQCSWA